MTRREAFAYGKEQLKLGNIPDGDWDAEVLLEKTLGCTRTGLLMDGAKELTVQEEESYRFLIGKRLAHVPLQHLTGEQEFMGLTFKVSPAVLIPRQDTEILVEQVLANLKDRNRDEKKMESGEEIKILDMCTGSGCIAVSLERLWKDQAGKHPAVTAVDISEDALKIAKENVMLNNSRVICRKSDLFSRVTGKFDIIVSNPPYIASREVDILMEEVRDFEPRLALDGMEDGLFFYDKIIKQAPDFLSENGWLFFEIGYDQGKAVSEMMQNSGYMEVEVKKDLAGLDRVVYGRICHV